LLLSLDLLDFVETLALHCLHLGEDLSIAEEQVSDLLKIFLTDELILPLEEAEEIASARKALSRSLIH
jgi:hypothetical protein